MSDQEFPWSCHGDGANPYGENEDDGVSGLFLDASTRQRFIFKVYKVLTRQWISVILLTGVFLFLAHQFRWIPVDPEYFRALLHLLFLFLLLGAWMSVGCYCKVLKKTSPGNVTTYLVCTLVEGVVAATVVFQSTTSDAVLFAGIILVVMVFLTLFTCQNKWEYTTLTGLFVAIPVVLSLFSLSFLILPKLEILDTDKVIGMNLFALFFSVVLVFTTQRVVRVGGEHKFTRRDHIWAAMIIQLYVLLFLYMVISSIFVSTLVGLFKPPESNNKIDDYEPYPRISGGIPVDLSDPISYQLSIRYENPEDGKWYHTCGGVILDEKTAITAAHCFDNSKDVNQYRVIAEEHILGVGERQEQVLHIKEIIIHPKYINFRNGNDIAILHVDKFQLGQNPYAQPVLFRAVSNKILSGLKAVISGWGYFSHKNELSNALQKGMKVSVRKGIVCAHDPIARTCSGDSGGPLVIQNYTVQVGNSTERGNLLVGITSFGPKECSRPNSAGVFTEINYFYSWIQAHRDQPLITSCSVAMEILPSPRSKKQRIYPHGNRTSLEVLCDFETDGGGWTVIQKRSSGPREEFQRNWNEYANGFGSLDKNFWIGLENIHTFTKNGDQELRIQLEDFEGEKRWAKYSSFSVSGASDFYRLSISGYSGDADDSMTDPDRYYMLNGMKFWTKGKNNDKYGGSCSLSRGGGGWWFNYCSLSGLNGLYFEKGESVPSYSGILWVSWKGWNYSLAKTEMKIRTRK